MKMKKTYARMMRPKRFIALCGLCAAMLVPAQSFAQKNEILEGFRDPAMQYRPRVWWHWMNGNITKDGIMKDLLWLKSAGVGGVQVFDAGLDVPTVVEKRLSYMSEDWKDAFNYAAELADSLGMELAIAGSGGWSDTGGPWVSNEQAQKTLKWNTVDVVGGKAVDIPLPAPDSIAGKYQSHSFFSIRKPEYDFYRDIAVIATRIPSFDAPMEELGVEITASDRVPTGKLSDGDLNEVCKVTPGSGSNAWIQFAFPSPVTIRSFFIGKKDDYKYYPHRHWEVSDDGVDFRKIEAVIPRVSIPFVTIDIPETCGRYFRYVNEIPGEDLNLTELRLCAATRVNLDTEKAGFFVDCGVRDFFPTPDYGSATPLGEVVDITPCLKDGRIAWDAPDGRWRLYRFGYTLRGRRNNPASPEATGLETDKLSAKATTDYFRTYLDKYNEATGGKVGKTLTHLMLDSYEAGGQTWTDNMLGEFRTRRGYDMLRWLPALAGQILGSSRETDRFLQDWRRTLGEMMAEYHYDALDPVLEEYGLQRYTEFHESSRGFPADGMAVKKGADIPMGAFWTQPDGLTTQRYMADIRESASVSHIYGQNTVAAESFTTDGSVSRPDGSLLSWDMTPERMKGAADIALASGLNLFVIHCSVHQPVDDRIPGISLGPYGLWFQRHETWAGEAAPFMQYLARSGYLLRQGRFVADLAYLVSETTNVSDRFQLEAPLIPDGYAYDFVNRDVVASGSFAYKAVLIDPETEYMSVELLRGLLSLAERGVIIASSEPASALGLSGDDEEFKAIVDGIWHSDRKNVVPFSGISDALLAAGCEPDVEFGATDKDGLRFVHRRLSDGELYFISSSRDSALSLPVSFKVCGRKPLLLRADSGSVEEVGYRMSDGRTTLTLDMGKRDACFVLFSDPTDAPSLDPHKPELARELSIECPWQLGFRSSVPAPGPVVMDTLALLSESNCDELRHFSGTSVYSGSFKWGRVRKGERYVLSLGRVFNMARVRINGTDCGLAWKEPFELDITDALRKGLNTVEIEVTNSWANHLIGYAGETASGARAARGARGASGATGVTAPASGATGVTAPASGARAATWVEPLLYGPDSPLPPSGLGGPVKLKVFK